MEMSENIDELRSMLTTFRVSELQTLLGFAGKNKSGRKTELQQRASELLRVRSHPVHQKIRDLYKTIQQTGNSRSVSPTAGPSAGKSEENMPQHPNTRATATVHPFNVDARPMSTRQQSALYGQSLYPNSFNQPQQQPQQQSSHSNTLPVHPDVKFRRLPFYDIISDLVKPSTLMPHSGQRMQEAIFFFHLTPQQSTDIAASRDVRPGMKCDYTKQVQLRFCLLETTCEQDDCFPPSVIVKINNKSCPLPNPIPTNKPGVEPKRPPRPVNITPMLKLSPVVSNTITVQWSPDYGRGYTITVALVHKLSSQDLFQRLRAKGVKHSDYTRGLIKDKLKEDADSEITTTSLRVSLVCPLGKMRMTTPCRAVTCNHLQCFDSSLFLQMNERKPTWICPVCDKPALYDNLVIDGYFEEVLSSPNLPADLNEIQLNKDGSWSAQEPDRSVVKYEQVPIDDSIEIISDDVVEFVSNAASSSSDPIKVDKSIVDLTYSDSEDDEPLSKRRLLNPMPDSTIKFSDTTSISSCSNQSRITTPGPSSVSSSGYPASPSITEPVIISLDSPSPPNFSEQSNPPSCMMNGNSNHSGGSLFSPGSMPFLDLDNDNSTPLSYRNF